MTRLTSLVLHAAAATAVGLGVTAPALAQSAPAPSRPVVVTPSIPTPAPRNMVQPPFAPDAIAPAAAQSPQPAQGQQSAPPAPRPEPRAPYLGGPNNQPMAASTNIRLDLTITDTFTGTPVKKSVSILVLTGNSGMIRTVSSDGWSTLNIDAIAAAYTGGQVSVRMTFEYRPAQPKDNPASGRAPSLNESITVVLQDGKPLVVSQSADPATDRKVTAELTATILK